MPVLLQLQPLKRLPCALTSASVLCVVNWYQPSTSNCRAGCLQRFPTLNIQLLPASSYGVVCSQLASIGTATTELGHAAGAVAPISGFFCRPQLPRQLPVFAQAWCSRAGSRSQRSGTSSPLSTPQTWMARCAPYPSALERTGKTARCSSWGMRAPLYVRRTHRGSSVARRTPPSPWCAPTPQSWLCFLCRFLLLHARRAVPARQ